MADGKRRFGRKNECVARLFLRFDVAKLRVVHHMATGQSGYHLGVTAQTEAHEGHERRGTLHVVAWLCQDNQVAFVATLS